MTPIICIIWYDNSFQWIVISWVLKAGFPYNLDFQLLCSMRLHRSKVYKIDFVKNQTCAHITYIRLYLNGKILIPCLSANTEEIRSIWNKILIKSIIDNFLSRMKRAKLMLPKLLLLFPTYISVQHWIKHMIHWGRSKTNNGLDRIKPILNTFEMKQSDPRAVRPALVIQVSMVLFIELVNVLSPCVFWQ